MANYDVELHTYEYLVQKNVRVCVLFFFGTLCSCDPLWRGFFSLGKPRKKRLASLARLMISNHDPRWTQKKYTYPNFYTPYSVLITIYPCNTKNRNYANFTCLPPGMVVTLTWTDYLAVIPRFRRFLFLTCNYLKTGYCSYSPLCKSESVTIRIYVPWGITSFDRSHRIRINSTSDRSTAIARTINTDSVWPVEGCYPSWNIYANRHAFTFTQGTIRTIPGFEVVTGEK